MKKRIEKVVECVKIGTNITLGNFYTILFENQDYYYITSDEGNLDCYGKQYFKSVSEREILEFEGDDLYNPYFYQGSTQIPIKDEIDLTNYDLKVIATPKEEDIEYWKNNAEENYLTTPISVLKYITKLEKLLKSKD